MSSHQRSQQQQKTTALHLRHLSGCRTRYNTMSLLFKHILGICIIIVIIIIIYSNNQIGSINRRLLVSAAVGLLSRNQKHRTDKDKNSTQNHSVVHSSFLFFSSFFLSFASTYLLNVDYFLTGWPISQLREFYFFPSFSSRSTHLPP